jgi:hypothetical protein
MSDAPQRLNGRDLTKGIPLTHVMDGTMVLGHVQGEPVGGHVKPRDCDAPISA